MHEPEKVWIRRVVQPVLYCMLTWRHWIYPATPSAAFATKCNSGHQSLQHDTTKTMKFGLDCGNLRCKVSSTPSRSDDLFSTCSIVHHLATSFSSFFLDLVLMSRSIPQHIRAIWPANECGNNSFTMGRLAKFRSIVILIRNCNTRLPLSLSDPWNKARLAAEVCMGRTYHC